MHQKNIVRLELLVKPNDINITIKQLVYAIAISRTEL